MKKLMIAAAIVCAAALSQAATIDWGLSGVNEGGTGVNGYAYVFSNKIGDYKSVSAVTDALKALTTAAAVESFLNDNSIAALNSAVTSGTAGKTGVAFGDTGLVSNQAGNRIFAVVTDTATITDATKWYVTETSAAVRTPDASTVGVGAFTIANQATPSGVAGAWNAVAVPEPTSGLLLLLGVAGLALKRRRA